MSVRLGWIPDDKLRFACAYRLVAGLSWKCNVGEPVGGPNSRSAIRRRWPEVPGVDAWRAMELGQGRANRRFAPGGSQRGRGGDPDPRQQWTRWPAQSAVVVRCGGNGESESGSAAGRLRDGNVPSVRVRDLSHECQTDAVARAIPGGSVGLSVREAVEQRFDGAWVDAHAVVTHIDEDVVMVPS